MSFLSADFIFTAATDAKDANSNGIASHWGMNELKVDCIW
jgi:hypothetical protein